MTPELSTTRLQPLIRRPRPEGRLWQAGRRAAFESRVVEGRPGGLAGWTARTAQLQKAIPTLMAKHGRQRTPLAENAHLIRLALADVREAGHTARHLPMVAAGPSDPQPRVVALASAYLSTVRDRFSEAGLIRFASAYQSIAELDTDEIWALKTALQLRLLERLWGSQPEVWPRLLAALRRVRESVWTGVFESLSVVERVLGHDPVDAYASMDAESRDRYRNVVCRLAERSGCAERGVAEIAVSLAERFQGGDLSPENARRSHVGFYLVDQGLAELEQFVDYRPGVRDRIRTLALRSPAAFYIGGIEILTFLVVFLLLSGLDGLTPVLGGLLLLLLPATQAAVDFMNNLTAFLVPPRTLPKLDFSKGIPDDCLTMVAVPSLLLGDEQVRELVRALEIRFLANRDPNLLFALITDSPDSEHAPDGHERRLGLCRELIEGLNRKYADKSKPFYLLYRHRVFNPSEGRWMGWERKRGKLLDLNRLLRGGFDSFPVKVGDLSRLPRVRYVITLDSDTQLPRDTAARLIGTLAHPLNRAVISPISKMVVEGYGILQPRIGISIHSASRSRLASLYSGQTGFDPYTRAVSDVYQDLFGEGSFTGKGIYDVDVLNEVLGHRFPDNALLSHDLIEGAYARAGLVSDIELIDDYPSHFSAYSRRKHRWVRGDWQILRWLLNRVPDYYGQSVQNPITVISRWKIVDNLRRSLFEPAVLLLLLAGWFWLPGPRLYWTVVTAAVLFAPVYAGFVFTILRAAIARPPLREWAVDTAWAFARGNLTAALSLVFLFHQALLSLDAIIRSVHRVFVSRRKLLEWETAAEAEAARHRRSTVDAYLEWTPVLTGAIGTALSWTRPDLLPAALPVLSLWFASRPISFWLNRPPRVQYTTLTPEDMRLLWESAGPIWRFFGDWSRPGTHWLIPDNVREDGKTAMRLSPTNLGLLLNARLAALHLGFLGLEDFVWQTRKTLEQVFRLPKFRGHLLNWYEIDPPEPIEPYFVSTVDSGNLVAALWTLKQGALAFAAEGHLSTELLQIAEACDLLVRDMDFGFLYRPGKQLLSIGYDIATERLSDANYDLLASESRIASFVAIAKGDIPQSVWFRLARAQGVYRGSRILLSWTGTMFEYLMPLLWMRHYRGTTAAQGAEGAVRAQMDFTRRQGLPWGVSESACTSPQGDAYAYRAFGVPSLAIKSQEAEPLVISPYSTFLALGVDPHAAVRNLRWMKRLGWSGRYGFYEAVDYEDPDGRGEVIRCWMAHHQGMSLLALCNLLAGNAIQNYFHAEPQVLATELLLHENAP